jgi:transcriptional regulator with XRE-family HTH domain
VAEELFAERLRRIRGELGWSQRRLSRAGYTAAYISRLEAGERQPSVHVIRQLAAELGVDPYYLENGSDDPLLIALREIASGSAKDPERRAARALKAHAEETGVPEPPA